MFEARVVCGKLEDVAPVRSERNLDNTQFVQGLTATCLATKQLCRFAEACSKLTLFNYFHVMPATLESIQKQITEGGTIGFVQPKEAVKV